MVIFDEFHDRVIYIPEVAFGPLFGKLQQILRPELKNLIDVGDYPMQRTFRLLNSKIIESKGRPIFLLKVNFASVVDEYAIGEDTARQLTIWPKVHKGDFSGFSYRPRWN